MGEGVGPNLTLLSIPGQYTVEQEQKTHEKLATRHGDKIICEDILFEFTHLGLGNGTAVARFDLVWSPTSLNNGQSPSTTALTSQHRLDNSQNMRVVIYKCAQLASNCGLCLGLNTQLYECGWCEEESRCESRDNCPAGWLVKGLGMPICPHPRIEDFEPKKGPLNGNTKIAIKGTNLGLSYSDVKGG